MSEEINYRLNWQVGSAHPGAHSGVFSGSGYLFHRYTPLLRHPDLRRVDMRASVLDPLQQLQVRAYQQYSQMNVYLLADLSASMRYYGQSHKQQVLLRIYNALAQSVFNYGDRFAFIGCTQEIQKSWILPLSHQRERASAMQQTLEITRLEGGAQGLFSAWRYVSSQRSLVFLCSDFNFPLIQLDPLLSKLQSHDLVPIVLWDNNECHHLPDWGFLNLRDMENGRQRLLWLRPGMREKLIAAYSQREAELKKCFRNHGREALFLTNGFNTDTINSFLQQRVA